MSETCVIEEYNPWLDETLRAKARMLLSFAIIISGILPLNSSRFSSMDTPESSLIYETDYLRAMKTSFRLQETRLADSLHNTRPAGQQRFAVREAEKPPQHMAMTIAAQATMLAWGGIEYSSAYTTAGLWSNYRALMQDLANLLVSLHQAPDQLLTLRSEPESLGFSHNSDLVIGVGCRGSDVAGEAAAALAAISILFRDNREYSNKLMSHAEDIFSIAEKYEGNFSTCSPEYNKHYRNSDFTDELSWASAWLYQATGENYYLEKSARYFSRIKGMRLPHPWKDSPDWQNKSYATALMLAIHTGNNNYIRIIREFLDFWIDHPENLSGKYSGSRRFYSAGDRPDVLYTNTAWLSLLFYDHFRNQKTPENTDLKYFWYARNRVDSVYRSPVDRHIQDSADDISHERLEHIYQVSTTINQPAFPGMAARMLDSNVPYRKTPGSPLQDAGIYGVVFMNELNNSASGADFSGTIKLHAKDPGAIKNLKLRYYKKLTAYEPARENITIISGTRNILKITRLERYRSMPDVFYTDLEIDHRKLDFDAAGNASIDALFSFHNKSPDDSEPIIIENDPSWPFQGRNTVPAEGVILIVNNQRIWGHEPSQPD